MVELLLIAGTMVATPLALLSLAELVTILVPAMVMAVTSSVVGESTSSAI